MSDTQLRKDLIRLAQEKPEYRRYLLPLVKKQATNAYGWLEIPDLVRLAPPANWDQETDVKSLLADLSAEIITGMYDHGPETPLIKEGTQVFDEVITWLRQWQNKIEQKYSHMK